jgi:death on curing protein
MMPVEFPVAYPTIEDIIELHAIAMRVSGDPVQGVNPEALDRLRGTLEHIQNDNYYRSLDAKLTHLFFFACKMHAFVEGNKRLAIAVGAKFLNDNGFHHRVPKFLRFMENVVVCVADNKISKEFLGEIVIAFLNEEEEDEQLKLKILDALEQVRNEQEQRDAQNGIC